MSGISSNYQIHHIPRTNQSAGAKIAEIKMEISKIKQQARAGLISLEEAQQKIAKLEAKLVRLESNPSEDDKQFVPLPVDSASNSEVKPLENSEKSHNENSNENTDAQQRQDSSNAYFEAQSINNRIFHQV